jgi:hypothetical protein
MSNKTGFSIKICRQNGVQCKVEQTRDRGQYTDEQKRGGIEYTYMQGTRKTYAEQSGGNTQLKWGKTN